MALPADFEATFINASGGAPLYDAAELRRADAAMFAGAGDTADPLKARGGIVRHASNSLAVTVNASDVVTIQAGAVVIPQNQTTGGGVYRCASPAAVTGTLTARDATNARIDLVIFRALDPEVVGTHTARTGRIEILTGTPSGTPVAPALPALAIELARITVPATGGGSPSVDSSKVLFVAAPGARLAVPTASALPATGLLREKAVALDTGFEYKWNGTSWVQLDSDWAVLASSVTGAWGIKYRLCAGIVTVIVDGGFTTTSGTTHTISTAALPAAFLPPTIVRGGGYFAGHPGVITVDGSGNVTAVQQSGANRGSVAGAISYPVAS